MMSSKSVMPQRDLETAAHAKSQPRNRRHRGHHRRLCKARRLWGARPQCGSGDVPNGFTARQVCPSTTSGKYQEHRR